MHRVPLELVRRFGVTMDRVVFYNWSLPNLRHGRAEVPYCDQITVHARMCKLGTCFLDNFGTCVVTKLDYLVTLSNADIPSTIQFLPE